MVFELYAKGDVNGYWDWKFEEHVSAPNLKAAIDFVLETTDFEDYGIDFKLKRDFAEE